MKKTLATAATGMLMTAALAGCGAGGSDAGSDADGATTLTVYAAASLQEPFELLGEEFEQEHDGVSVEFSFAGSSNLVAQIEEGAPADVFASADTANMDKLVDAGLEAAEPVDFATNTLTIATPAGNPADVASLQDLADPSIALVICAPEVPCGSATAQVADEAGIALDPVSEEQSVTDVLGKVVSGEGDAGLVYVTDAQKAGDDVEAIDFPEAESVVNQYPIAPVADTEHGELADEFIDLVTGSEGQAVLAEHGFGAP